MILATVIGLTIVALGTVVFRVLIFDQDPSQGVERAAVSTAAASIPTPVGRAQKLPNRAVLVVTPSTRPGRPVGKGATITWWQRTRSFVVLLFAVAALAGAIGAALGFLILLASAQLS